MRILIVLLSIVASLSGCRMGPEYVPPPVSVPEGWKNGDEDSPGTQEVDNWWEIFDDEELNDLECRALNNNKDLFAAFERIIQARAISGIVDSERYPQLSLDPFYANEGIRYMLYDPTRVVREHRRRNHIPFDLNYEIDLWGKLASAYESSTRYVEAEMEAYNTSMLILTTDLALSYFRIRTFDADLALLEQTLESRKKAYEIVKSRYESKIIDYSDVSRAEYEYNNTQAAFYNALKFRNLEENRMAVLLGVPASDFKMGRMALNGEPPVIPAGIPTDILLQRPDIAQAERTMASDHAQVGVAYASFFPSFSLTGALGFSSPELIDFLKWNSRLWAIGANVSQTIFDAGRLSSNLEFAQSKFREANDLYQQQVIEAFREVEDALASLDGLKSEYGSIDLAVKASKKTNKIATDRYLKGVSFYLDVVDSERTELDAQRSLIGLLGQEYEATVELIKALGGCWKVEGCVEKNNVNEVKCYAPLL